MKKKISIVGATGYVGLELVRLLSAHPGVEFAHLCSQSYVGQDIADIYPSLKGAASHTLCGLDEDALAQDSDLIFTSLPHGASDVVIPSLYDKGACVVDMSGDFRYDDVAVYERWYQTTHKRPDLLGKAVFGLPEIYREQVKAARLIGNPGCYTTCAILAAAPLLRAGVAKAQGIVVDAKSGATGAGAKASQNTHFCEVDESMKAYGIATHRHTSEIEQELTKAAGQEVVLSFTPHLLPIKRGILATLYMSLKPGCGAAQVAAAYAAAYAEEPFVTVLAAGETPHIKHVVGSNRCMIGFVVDERVGRVVVVSVIDNLIKGAAGQAIQNMNLMLGFEETAGLPMAGMYL